MAGRGPRFTAFSILHNAAGTLDGYSNLTLYFVKDEAPKFATFHASGKETSSKRLTSPVFANLTYNPSVM
jgi:hypothetical protein